MRACVLIDSNAHPPCIGEWGLSVYFEYGEHRLLLDAGATGAFAENAEKMGIPLEQVDYAVLSHAHYDHSDGMEAFFARNRTAKLYLRDACNRRCFSSSGGTLHEIGIRPGLLARSPKQIAYVTGKVCLTPGVWLVPHETALPAIGAQAGLFTLSNGRYVPDDLAHEQSLIFETEQGLVICSSCTHGGIASILHDAAEAFPGQRLYALLGGLHLHRASLAQIEAVAALLTQAGLERILLGHCTGDAAIALLRERLNGRVEQMYSGMVVTLP